MIRLSVNAQLGVTHLHKIGTSLNSDKNKKEKKMNREKVLELMDVGRHTYRHSLEGDSEVSEWFYAHNLLKESRVNAKTQVIHVKL